MENIENTYTINIVLSELEYSYIKEIVESQNTTIENYIKDYLNKDYKQYLSNIDFKNQIERTQNEVDRQKELIRIERERRNQKGRNLLNNGFKY